MFIFLLRVSGICLCLTRISETGKVKTTAPDFPDMFLLER